MRSICRAIAGVGLAAATLATAGPAISQVTPVPRQQAAPPGHVTHLVFEFQHRSSVPGNEDVGVEIRMLGGRAMTVPNLNESRPWSAGTSVTRAVALSPSVPLEDVLELVFFKRQGAPWNATMRVRALGPNNLNRVLRERHSISVAPQSVAIVSWGWMLLDVVPGTGGLPPRQTLNLIATYPQQSTGFNSHLFQNINGGAAWEANRMERILLQLPSEAGSLPWARPERLYLFNATSDRDAVPVSVNAIRVTVRTGGGEHVLFPAPPRRGVARSQPITLPVLMLVPTLN